MPVVPFDRLPDASRVWVFGSDVPITGEQARVLLSGVDAHLESWRAHGAPLTVGRDWRDDRFLVVAVDQSTEGASGCSIDGLFRVLQAVQRSVGANLVGGGRVFYRDASGTVQCASRPDVERLAAEGRIATNSVVFDTTLTELGAWRTQFERPVRESWVAELLPS